MIRVARIALAMLFTLTIGIAFAEEPRPNVVLFIVDDLGWQDVSLPFHDVATPLNARYHTPNLEALAKQGMRFTNAYASAPVCTPTRTSILTGQSPGQSHISYWTLDKDKDTSTAHPTLRPPAWRMNGLSEHDVTLPRLLRAAGYQTIHVGKAHFGARGTSGADPCALGFDVNIAGHAAGGPASYWGEHDFTLAGRRGKDPKSSKSGWDIPGLEKYHGKDIFLTEALTREAVRALEEAVAAKKPFYLNFALYAVHAPIMANRKYLGRYAQLDDREAAYATMVETVDVALGQIVAKLGELGVLDNTLFIYTSDNGGLSAHARGKAPDGRSKHTHNAPLRSGKGSCYEGGVRVPWVVRWPGRVASGSVCATPIISHDLFPTILAATGVAMPKALRRKVEGVDLLPMFDGKGAIGDRALFWHQPHQWGAKGPGIEPFTAMRSGRWKLIYFHAERRFELYDLAIDLSETRDLAIEEPERVRELAQEMDIWIGRFGVQLSIDKATGEAIARPGKVAGR